MKQAIPLLFLILLLVGISGTGITHENTNPGKLFDFSPQDITLVDDAFHGHGMLPFTEWWYFDAMFDNGYSAQMSIRIASLYGKGMVFVRLDLYNNTLLLSHNSQLYPVNEIVASSTLPLVQLQGKTIMAGSCNTSTGEFIYDVSFEFPENAARLRFLGCTKGWKGILNSGAWWAVILPHADVTGTIIVNNTTINVTGVGYHDHDWEVDTRMCVNFGWFWGKINTKEFTATWSTILTTRATTQPILIVNVKNAGYISVPSKTIWFTAEDFSLDHFMLVPQSFSVETMTDDVFLVAHMQTISVHHERFMGLMNYWRYHLKCSGTIMVNGQAQTVDGVFIAEYIRFR
jgi:hypothetical protein